MDVLDFIKYINPSLPNLKFKLRLLYKSLERRNNTIENDKHLTEKQRKYWFKLLNKVELECIVIEDLIENYNLVKEYLL